MKVLITYAVESEFTPWRQLREFREILVGDVLVRQTQIGRATVDFVVTGMGPANAKRAATAAMSLPHAICICAGFAGGLKPEHRVGDILAAEAVQQVGKSKTLECNLRLATLALGCGAKRVKRFFTSDTVIANAEEKARLAPFADAVDLESFAILSAAREHDLSAVVIRVISDPYDQDMPVDFGASIDERGQVRIGGIVRAVVTHPLQIPALIRLGRESRTAAQGLAHFLEAYIKQISFSTHGWPPADLVEVAAQRSGPKATA
jgi:adenosylhomocysteine nucleosidase